MSAKCESCAEWAASAEADSDKYHDLNDAYAFAWCDGYAAGVRATREATIAAANDVSVIPDGKGYGYRPGYVLAVREWLELHHMMDEDDSRGPGRMFVVESSGFGVLSKGDETDG